MVKAKEILWYDRGNNQFIGFVGVLQMFTINISKNLMTDQTIFNLMTMFQGGPEITFMHRMTTFTSLEEAKQHASVALQGFIEAIAECQ